MRVFEFHFNPLLKGKTKIIPDLVFDSFCYEPENIYERKMGSLYMVGLLKNVLPKNTRFIEKLVKVIKDKYYRSAIFSPEKALKESLKLANEFLEKITKRGDVSWLGNLSFAVISLSSFKMNFTKVGDIKVLVIREGKIIDIDEKVRLQEIEPYPLKIFSNTVSGKLSKNDMVLIITEDIFNFFKNQNLLKEIAKLEPFTEKGLREILNGKEELLGNNSGVLLTIIVTKEIQAGKKETISPKVLKEFSLKEVFSPVLRFFKKEKALPSKKVRKKIPVSGEKKIISSLTPKNILSAIQKRIKKPSINLSNIKKKIKLPQIKLPKFVISSFNTKIRPIFINKKIGLILGLTIILIFGFSMAKWEKERNIELYGKDLEVIQEKLDLINSLLVLEETTPEATQKANSLLKECWQEIDLLSKNVKGLPNNFTTQVLSLKNEISEKLSVLNKLEKIENPQLFYEFERKTFVPNNVLLLDNVLYFFSPYIENVFGLTDKLETSLVETNQKINLATKLGNSISFFVKPNQIITLKNNDLTPFSLETPYLNFNFDDLHSYRDNLYFLDKKTGQIIKYPYSGNFNWGSPQLWLNPQIPKVIGANSFSIDGSVWVLNQNLIYKYHGGDLQKEINLEIFPVPKNFSKIFTSHTLPYLYILEPDQKRIVIIDEAGTIIKQLESEKFDNLLDFAVSESEKTIYLLNGLKVYKVEY